MAAAGSLFRFDFLDQDGEDVMIAYTVHEPKDLPASSLDGAERVVFIKEGFAWLAAFPYTSAFWLLAHRLWLFAAAYVAAVAALVAMMAWFPGAQAIAGGTLAALHLALGLEGNGLRRWSLERHGYRLSGVASGRTLEECERRFFDDWFAETKSAVAASAAFQPNFSGQAVAKATPLSAPTAAHTDGRTTASMPSANPVGDGWERLRAALSDLRR